jgi:glutaredoxin-like protein
MGLLQARDRKVVEREFKKLQNPVKLVMFTQEMECQFCQHTRELMEEVASLSDALRVEVYDFVKDNDKALQYQIDKIPATVIEGEKDYGIRMFGIPSGYEFTTLMEGIVMVSTGEAGLSQKTLDQIQSIHTSIHIQAFVTPT